MRLSKMLLLIGLMLGLSGCYTQLEYSQKMNRVTDDRSQAQQKEQDRRDDTSEEYYADDYEEEEYIYDEETNEYIPVTYRNYNVYKFYNDCYCSSYAGYDYFDNWYGSPGISFSFTFGRPYWSSRYYWNRHSSWHRYMAFNHRSHYYHHWRSGWWGYNPHPYYSSYYYGYPAHYSFIYNTYYPVTKGSYTDNDVKNGSYGPRNIGTDRVASSDANSARSRATTSSRMKSQNNSDSTQDSRIITRTRSASDTNRTKVTGERTRTNAVRQSGNNATRKTGIRRTRVKKDTDIRSLSGSLRSTLQNKRSDNSTSVSRIGVRSDNSRSTLNRKELRSSLERKRVEINRGEDDKKRSSFFGNLGKALKHNVGTNSTRTRLRSSKDNSSSSGILKRAKSSSPKVKSKLKKSRSSSSSSKSRVRSSSSSNRGSSSSDSSSRSRSKSGNN